MKWNYDDIINFEHHISDTRPRMPVEARAAQFAPFSALTGYSDEVAEVARYTDSRFELTEESRLIIDSRLQFLRDTIRKEFLVSVRYFKPDIHKDGGAYIVSTGTVQKIDEYKSVLLMSDGSLIPFDEIVAIEGEIFDRIWGYK